MKCDKEIKPMRKRLLSALLSLALLLALVPNAFATSANPYTDVSIEDWFYPAVEYMSSKGYMTGYSTTQFAPNDTLSRAMFVTILYRVSGEKANATNTKFTDVAQGTWYTEAVTWAVANNITSGTTTTTFSPNDPVTREQMAVFIKRYMDARGLKAPNLMIVDNPLDIKATSEWAKNAVQVTYSFGVLMKTDGKINPTGNATRKDAVVAFYNFLYSYGKIDNGNLLLPTHTHNWITKQINEIGHMEQVFAGYGKEPIYETRRVYECKVCKGVFNSYEEFDLHCGFSTGNWDFDNPCLLAGSYFYDDKVKVGEKEVPIYEDRWVVDVPETTIHFCEICGVMK